MVLPTVITEGIVGKQFQSYDMHVCDFSSTMSGRPPFLKTTRGGGKVKNNIMQIDGKKERFFSSLGLLPCFSRGFAPHPLHVLAFYHVLKEKVGDYSWSRL